MTIRELPDFLKQGDKPLRLPRPRNPVCPIGKGFPEARPAAAPGTHDPQSRRDQAAREWHRALAAGLIGG